MPVSLMDSKVRFGNSSTTEIDILFTVRVNIQQSTIRFDWRERRPDGLFRRN